MPNTDALFYMTLITGAVIGVLSFRQMKLKSQRQERVIKELQEMVAVQQRQSTTERSELNVILSSMVEGVLVIGRDDKIQYISPNVSDMFDFRSKALTAKSYWEVIPHGQIISAIKETLQSSKAVSREIVLFQQTDIVFNIQVSPVINDGLLMGAVAVFHDITELKKLLKMRSEFVANVSHELKTPLTSIKGYVETLREAGGLDDKASVQKFLGVIEKQTLRLEDLVKDLLTLSAIETKEVVMDLQSCDMKAIIDNVVNILKPSTKQNVIVLAPSNILKVRVDRNRMEQVFINLLENAIKFTPSQGTIEISVIDQNPYIRVDVKDSGIGIAPEHLPRLFERFYRVDKARSTELGSTGLGLAIVKHIVQAHQGRVEVQSKPEQGSTFSVFLPAFKN